MTCLIPHTTNGGPQEDYYLVIGFLCGIMRMRPAAQVRVPTGGSIHDLRRAVPGTIQTFGF